MLAYSHPLVHLVSNTPLNVLEIASDKARETAPKSQFPRNDLMNLATRLATLRRQQALIQARQDIWQTIARYARGIDEQRSDDRAERLTLAMISSTWII
jgi:hypothetical protein